jgi:hypothetical protein
MFTHEIQYTWRGGGTPITKSVSLQAEAEENRDIDLIGAVTNLLVELVIDVSQLKMIFITCDKAATVKTNSSSSPQETITIAAGGVFQWATGQGIANPFADDVTAIYVSKPGSNNGVLSVRALIDPTP